MSDKGVCRTAPTSLGLLYIPTHLHTKKGDSVDFVCALNVTQPWLFVEMLL